MISDRNTETPRHERSAPWMDAWRLEIRSFDQFVATYRPYLKSLAESNLPAALQSKLDGSDLVQDTLLKGYSQLNQFQGTTENELLAWLKAILENQLVDTERFHQRQCRDVRREQLLEQEVSDQANDTGSAVLMRSERDALLRQRLDELPTDFRTVLLLRHEQGLSFPEIGERMSRSADASRMLWGRATIKLGELLASNDSSR